MVGLCALPEPIYGLPQGARHVPRRPRPLPGRRGAPPMLIRPQPRLQLLQGAGTVARMTLLATPAPDAGRAERLLMALGADTIDHPGGTRFAHLRRVAVLLGQWGASPVVQIAGLCHAFYGTDGFAPSLHPSLIGPGSRERSGRRSRRWCTASPAATGPPRTPTWGQPGPLTFTDRVHRNHPAARRGRREGLHGDHRRQRARRHRAQPLDGSTVRRRAVGSVRPRGALLSRPAWAACEATLGRQAKRVDRPKSGDR